MFWLVARVVVTAVLATVAAASAYTYFSNGESHHNTYNNNRNQDSPRPSRSPPRRRRTQPSDRNSTSRFSQLRETMKDYLNSGTYDCVICWENIAPHAQIASCKSCYVINHLECLRKVVSSATANGNDPACPQCRDKLPTTLVYKCFCGKKMNPRPPQGVTPHSCGGICGKRISTGPCDLFCHPGPCS